MGMTDRQPRFSPLSVVGDGLLLLSALMGFTGSFLSLYGSEKLGEVMNFQTSPLDQCAVWTGNFLVLSAVFALLALAAWSLPRYWAAAAGGLAALLGAAVFFNREGVVRGAGLCVRTISVVFSQRVDWGRVFPYAPELTLIQEGAAARLFLVLALALLALTLGWAVVRARCWWLAVLLTLPPLLPGLLADLYPSWPAFMALCACWCAMLLCDLCRWAAPSGRGRLTLAALCCAVVVLGGVTLVFPREGYVRPQWVLDLEVELRSVSNRLADFFSKFDGPFGATVTYVGAAEEADLADAGPLRYTGRTVLRVEGDYDGRMYLRGSSLAVYENGRWAALPKGAYGEYDQPGSVGTLAPFPLYFPALMGMGGQEHTVAIDNVAAVGSCVYAPYFPLVQDLEAGGMLPVEDAYLARRSGQWRHTVSFTDCTPPEPEPGGPGRPVVTFTDAAYAVFSKVNESYNRYRNFVYNHYLDAPAELKDFLAGFCIDNGVYGSFRGVNGPVETAEQIAALLDGLCEYDPSAPAPPEGVDPVLYFLNESRRGYCMHYASAAALMLRSLGIPARYVSGFTADCRPGQRVNVPDRAAHAWVEVWLDGFGWYPVEVTPAAAFDWAQSDPPASLELPSAPVEESLEPEAAPTPSQAPAASPLPSQGLQGEADDGPETVPSFAAALLPALAKILGTAAGVFALLWLGQYLPKRRRARKLSASDRNRAALDAYSYLRRMARWGGRMDERVVELAQKARFSQHTLTSGELDELRAHMDRERERLCVVLDPLPRLVFRYFWGMPKAKRPPKNRG